MTEEEKREFEKLAKIYDEVAERHRKMREEEERRASDIVHLRRENYLLKELVEELWSLIDYDAGSDGELDAARYLMRELGKLGVQWQDH